MENTDTPLPDYTDDVMTSDPGLGVEDDSKYLPAKVVRVVGTVFIVLLATAGNPLSFVVLRSKRLRHSTTSLLLAFLAIVDLLAVYLALLPHVISMATGSYVRHHSDFLCKFFWFAPLFFTQLSSWVLVLVSVERVVAVWFPIKAKTFRTVKSTSIALTTVTLFLFLANTRFFFTRKLIDGACVPNPPFANFESAASIWLARMLYWGVPCAVMVTCNLLIFAKIRLLRFHGNPEAAGRFHNKTIIMISNSIAFIACTTPLVVFNITYCGWCYNTPDPSAKYELANSFFIILAFMNHAINFILYCVAGKRFREEFTYVVLRKSRAVYPEPSTTFPPSRRSRLESRMEVGFRLDTGFVS